MAEHLGVDLEPRVDPAEEVLRFHDQRELDVGGDVVGAAGELDHPQAGAAGRREVGGPLAHLALEEEEATLVLRRELSALVQEGVGALVEPVEAQRAQVVRDPPPACVRGPRVAEGVDQRDARALGDGPDQPLLLRIEAARLPEHPGALAAEDGERLLDRVLLRGAERDARGGGPGVSPIVSAPCPRRVRRRPRERVARAEDRFGGQEDDGAAALFVQAERLFEALRQGLDPVEVDRRVSGAQRGPRACPRPA